MVKRTLEVETRMPNPEGQLMTIRQAIDHMCANPFEVVTDRDGVQHRYNRELNRIECRTTRINWRWDLAAINRYYQRPENSIL